MIMKHHNPTVVDELWWGDSPARALGVSLTGVSNPVMWLGRYIVERFYFGPVFLASNDTAPAEKLFAAPRNWRIV